MADDPKLTEFREKNIALLKEIDDLKAKYQGIDPAAVVADRARLTEFEKDKPHERATALAAELATEKAAHADTRQRADGALIENKIADAFSRAGGRPQARTFIVAQAAGMFTVEKGELRGTKHSPARPGEPMTLDEWITLQTRENAFAFLSSSGSGADPKPSGIPFTGKVLRNPTPQDLGRYASELARGDMKVVYE